MTRVRRAGDRREGGEELRMDVYRSRDIAPGEPLPAIVFVRGGPIPRGMLPPPEWGGVFISYGEFAHRPTKEDGRARGTLHLDSRTASPAR